MSYEECYGALIGVMGVGVLNVSSGSPRMCCRLVGSSVLYGGATRSSVTIGDAL